MAENRISFSFISDTPDGHVRLSDFIQQLESFKVALQKTERLISGESDSLVQYRVVGLRHNSPATVVVEAFSSSPDSVAPGKIVSTLIDSIKQIRATGLRKPKPEPTHLDLPTLEAYRDLSGALEKSVSKVVIKNTKQRVTIDRDFREEVIKIIGPDKIIMGSLTGRLEKINLHNTTQFNMYPPIGPARVSCDFPPNLKQAVKDALDETVTVSGRLRYKKWYKFPYAVSVDRIRKHAPQDLVPSLNSLRGIFPDATGNVSSEEFVRKARDEWKD